MKRTLPHSPGINPADVHRVAQNQNAAKLADRYNIQLKRMRDWLSGVEAMPPWLFELLAFNVVCVLPETAGLFKGWRVIDGERFAGPNLMHKGGIHWIDIDRLPEYRSARHLADSQADLIERLIKERDFYRRQLQLETMTGLIVRQMVDGPPQKPPRNSGRMSA